MNTKDKIQSILSKQFNIHSLNITDDSDLHKGHSEAQKSGGGHFSVTLVSDDFKDIPLIKRHRMVHDALKEIRSEIHALSIKTLTHEEI